MSKEEKSKTLGTISIVLGVISFIPLVGFFTGSIAAILGIIDIVRNKSKLGIIGLVLGVLGVLLTIGIYGSLFYIMFKDEGGMYNNLQTTSVETQYLPNTVNTIEAYKARFDKYPDEISDLNEISSYPFIIIDPLQTSNNLFNDDYDSFFYYKNFGDTYYLFSRGADGEPFTEDDVFPNIIGESESLGYRRP